jgi:hypothetical protein
MYSLNSEASILPRRMSAAGCGSNSAAAADSGGVVKPAFLRSARSRESTFRLRFGDRQTWKSAAAGRISPKIGRPAHDSRWPRMVSAAIGRCRQADIRSSARTPRALQAGRVSACRRRSAGLGKKSLRRPPDGHARSDARASSPHPFELVFAALTGEDRHTVKRDSLFSPGSLGLTG